MGRSTRSYSSRVQCPATFWNAVRTGKSGSGRSVLRLLAAGGLGLFAAMPATAQQAGGDAVDARVQEILSEAQGVLSAVPPRPRCEGGSSDEIVVCATTDSRKYRVPSTIESNPGSRAALRTGIPSPPQLDRGSCRGQPNCMIGGYTPPPVYAIDLKAIPEAPPGSDADRVARGEVTDR